MLNYFRFIIYLMTIIYHCVICEKKVDLSNSSSLNGHKLICSQCQYDYFMTEDRTYEEGYNYLKKWRESDYYNHKEVITNEKI